MKSTICLFSWFLGKRKKKETLFFFPLCRVKPWHGLRCVIQVLSWQHTTLSLHLHKLASEFLSHSLYPPLCVWLGHPCDGKWKKLGANWGWENYVIKDRNTPKTFCNLDDHTSAYKKRNGLRLLRENLSVIYSTPFKSFVFMNISVGYRVKLYIQERWESRGFRNVRNLSRPSVLNSGLHHKTQCHRNFFKHRHSLIYSKNSPIFYETRTFTTEPKNSWTICRVN
jgi:hypothetical protein